MKRSDKDSRRGQSNLDAPEALPAPGSRMRFVPPPDDPYALERNQLPGIYRFTFPVCEARPVLDRFRLFIRMVVTGPLESEAPRDIVNELDITESLATVRDELLALGISLEGRDLDEACAVLQRRVLHMHFYCYLNQDLERELVKEMITAKEAEDRLHGRSPWSRKLRVAPTPVSKGRQKGSTKLRSAHRQRMSVPVILWATILRCDAQPLDCGAGYEIAWEASIDDYVGAPLIHKWKHRVDSVQSYEEFRRDLEVLCVELKSYRDIGNACLAALGKNVVVERPLIDIGEGKALLLEHFTEKSHQLPPLHERLTLDQAEAYCRQSGLEAFAGDLSKTQFRDEVNSAILTGATPEAEAGVLVDGNEQQCPETLTEIEVLPPETLFGRIINTYELVQAPVEPYASNPVAPHGMFWLKATHCTVQQKGRHYHAQIRLVMHNHDLDPPFEATFELYRKLTYKQLQEEFRKLQVCLTHPSGVQDACRTAIRTIGYDSCSPFKASAEMDQDGELI